MRKDIDTTQQFGEFLKNTNLVELIDVMAKRYGRLPSEILREQSISDFNLNVAVMVVALKLDADRQEQSQKGKGRGKSDDSDSSFKDLGFKVTKRKK